MRNAVLLTLMISIIGLAGCKHATGVTPQTTYTAVETLDALRTNCKNTGAGNKNKNRPVVCISIFSGGASVNPVVTLAAPKDLDNNRNKIKFISRGADDYVIEFKSAGCVAETKLTCREECDVEVDQYALNKKECGYSVVLTRIEDGKSVTITLDPIVIIDTE